MPGGGAMSKLVRDLLFEISPACLSTWYMRSTSVVSIHVYEIFESNQLIITEVYFHNYVNEFRSSFKYFQRI